MIRGVAKQIGTREFNAAEEQHEQQRSNQSELDGRGALTIS
jgi:hypothetical protein